VRLIEKRITDDFVTYFIILINSSYVRTLSIILITLLSVRMEPGAWSIIPIMLNTHYSVIIPFFAISILIFHDFSRVDGINT
jgi:hypothetical protein